MRWFQSGSRCLGLEMIFYSGDKRAELIEMLIIMEILIKTLIKTCAHCPRFLYGTNEILNDIELASMIVFT